MLYGLAGMTISTLCFGLSKSYLALVLSRALSGALSGNVGVMKSAICEIMDERTMAEGPGTDLFPHNDTWTDACTVIQALHYFR